MATLQVRIDDELKQNADKLFLSLGLDTPTAVRIFLKASLEHDGIPFDVAHLHPKKELLIGFTFIRCLCIMFLCVSLV